MAIHPLLGRCLLSELRERRGWNQQELARRSGIHFSQISGWENNVRVMSLSTAIHLAGVLRCNVLELYDHAEHLYHRNGGK